MDTSTSTAPRTRADTRFRTADTVVTLKSAILFIVLTILNVSVFVFMVFENQTELIAKNAELESRDKGIAIKLEVESIVTGREAGDARVRYEIKEPLARVFSSQDANTIALDTLVLGETVFSEREVEGWHQVVYRASRTGWIRADMLARHVPAWNTGRLTAEDVRLILEALEREGVTEFTVFMESGHILADSRGREGSQADDREAGFIKKAIFNSSFRYLAFYQDVRPDEEVVDLYIPVYYSLNRLLVIRPTIPMRYVAAQKAFLYRQCVVIGLLVLLVHILFVYVNQRTIIRPMVERRTELLSAQNRQLQDARGKLQETYDELSKSHAIVEDELEMARDLQLSLIPEEAPTIPGFSLTARYIPAKRVSGDYYDVYPIDEDHMGVLIADASGHGIPAAFVVSMAKMTFSTHAVAQLSSSQTMGGANDELAQVIKTFHYLTAFYFVLDLKTGEMSYTRASHPPPVLQRAASRNLEFLDTDGLFVAMMEHCDYGEKQTTMEKGDRLFMFTDGIFEVLGPAQNQYGRDRIAQFIEAHHDMPSEELADAILADVRAYASGEPFLDDITLLILNRT